jgi:hypothetical protein
MVSIKDTITVATTMNSLAAIAAPMRPSPINPSLIVFAVVDVSRAEAVP